MSFRLEDKIKLHISDKIKLKNLIYNQKGKSLYPKRKILSTYFDNKNLDMYKDSEEGTLPRKKIRIRHYPNNEEKIKNLEVKINSVEGKFKRNERISNKSYLSYFNKGIYDPVYGLCNKVIQISYDREYYLLNNARLTIDCNIKYKNYYFFDNKNHFKEKIATILKTKGPVFINIKTKIGAIKNLSRPKNLKEIKNNFLK